MTSSYTKRASQTKVIGSATMSVDESADLDSPPYTASIVAGGNEGSASVLEVRQHASVTENDVPTGAMISPASVLGITSGSDGLEASVKFGSQLPPSVRWNSRVDRPWGLGDDYEPRQNRSVTDLETIRMGSTSWFFRANGVRSYDTLRQAFVGERLAGGRTNCGCISSYAFGKATVDCEAQLAFMRAVLWRVLSAMPVLELDNLCTDMFGGHRHLCEHYLWWLENEAFVAHPVGQERQDRLLLTNEGFVTLAMLESTKPGSNVDLSPKAVHALRQREGSLSDLDKPRFLRAKAEQQSWTRSQSSTPRGLRFYARNS